MTTRQIAYDAMLAIKETRDIDDTDYALADAIHDALAALSSPEATPAGVLDEAAIERLLATLTDRFHEARAGTPEWRDGIRLGLQIAMNEIGYATSPALAALGRSGSGGGRG